MKTYILKVIAAFNNAWLNDDRLPDYLLPKIQSRIDNLIADSKLYADISGHYLTLGDFNQATKYSRKSDKCEEKLEDLIDLIDSNNGYILLNNNRLTY